MGSHSEGKANVHAAGVAFYRRVQELVNLGEGYDFVKLLLDFSSLHAYDSAVEIDVLPARKLGMEAGAHLQKRANSSVYLDTALRGRGDAREDFQYSSLTTSIPADNTYSFTTIDLEGDVFEGPNMVGLMADSSWLMVARGGWLVAHGSWLMAGG